MGELGNLFRVKQIFAVVLAVALAVTSLSVEAYAAVPGENQPDTEADVEEISTQSDVNMEGEEGQESSVATVEDPTDHVQAGTGQTDQPHGEDMSQTSEESAESQEKVDEADNGTQPSTVELEESKFSGIVQQPSVYKADGTSPVADETGKRLSVDFLNNYSVTVNHEFKSLASITDPVISTITYQWFAGDSALGDPKKLAEEGALPIDTGSYTLKFVLPARENEYKGTEAVFEYEITKAEVTAEIDVPTAVPAGTKWAEVPMLPVKSVTADNGRQFAYAVDDKNTEINEAADNEVAFTIVIKDAETGVILTGEQTLVKNREYVVNVFPEFIGADKDKYEKNYTWKHCEEQKLPVGDLKATRITLTLDASYKAKSAIMATNEGDGPIVQIIDGILLTKEIQELKYTALLEADNGRDEQDKPKWQTVEGQTVGEWYTTAYFGQPWIENDKLYCNLTIGGKLDAAPTREGTYIYRVSYEGDQREYGASYADIVVIALADVPEIIIRPAIPSGVKFYERQTVLDVLSQITYELPYVDNRTEGGKEALYPKKPDMWGTCNKFNNYGQYYTPAFELVEIVRDKDGREISRRIYDETRWVYNEDGERIDYVFSEETELKSGNDYIVRFNGKKHAYDASGNPEKWNLVNIDSGLDPAVCGFRVKTDPATLKAEANTCRLIVTEEDGAIDVTEIEKAAVDKENMTLENVGALEGVFTKIYDGIQIFESHGDYKKAQLVSGSSDPYNDFVYTWQKSEYSYAELQETHQEEGLTVPNISKWELENDWNWSDTTLPAKAGVYRLHVAYKKSRTNGFVVLTDVYFVIKPQEITLSFNRQGLTGYVGTDLDGFTAGHIQQLNEGTAIKPAKEQPATAEDWKNTGLLSTSVDYAYQIGWGFYVKEKETNAEGLQVDKTGPDGKPVWNQYYGSLQDGGEYYLGVSSFRMGSYDAESGSLRNMDDFKQNFDPKTDIYIPVTVKAMGTGAIVFEGITTTDGKKVVKTKTYDAESVYTLIRDELARLNAPVVIRTDAAGVETKEAVNFAEGEYGLNYTIQNTATGEKKTCAVLPVEEKEWEWTKNAGVYTVSVSFGGNEKYDALDAAELAVLTVKKKELVFVIPELTEEFTAGQKITDVIEAAHYAFNQQDTAGVKAAEGVIPAADQEYFTRTEIDGKTGFTAWYDEKKKEFGMPAINVRDNKSGVQYDSEDSYTLLQGTGDKRYSVVGDHVVQGEDHFTGFCSINYTIAAVEPAKGRPVKVVRGASAVELEERAGKKLDIVDDTEVPEGDGGSIVRVHTITIRDGIAYYNNPRGNSVSDNSIRKDSISDNNVFDPEEGGNFVVIRIKAPAEYAKDSFFSWNKVSYEQSIKSAAGHRLIDSFTTDDGSQTLEFVYDATVLEKEEKKDLVFSIRWEEDYNERFVVKFSEAELLGNLREAVAPKSLAFNAPRTTMVVGQEQELDVKIKKVQNADVICLGYEVTAGREYMHVNEFGKVTALKAGGKATVEVYPMYLADGKKVRIDGAKSAKTTIAVKDVSAPKGTKVTARDTSAIVEYTLPGEGDGYRREIYVVEGMDVTTETIEKKITDEMRNQQWQGIFAVAPKFLSHADEVAARTFHYKKGTYTNTVRIKIDGLNLRQDYTVYVRNVSSARSFVDGCQVSLSAAGAATGCTTTAKQAEDLTAELKDKQIVSVYDGDSFKEFMDGMPTEEEIRNAYMIDYEVALTEQNVQFALEGLFEDAAGDEIYAPIPFPESEVESLKSSYTEPKITYYFYEYIYDGYDACSGERVIESYGYTAASSIAAVDKNGRLIPKQPGQVIIYAADAISGAESNAVRIRITAEADSLKAKNTVMQVGQRIRLENLVEYRQGKTVLNQTGYDTYGRIDVKEAQDSLRNAGKESSFGISDNGYLTVYAKDSVKLTLRDTVLNTSVTVKITAKELAAVKSLKAVNVIDNRFDVQFEMNQYAEAYRIRILDARRTVRSIYVENIPFSGDGSAYADDDGYWRRCDDWKDDDWGNAAWNNDDWLHISEHFVKEDGSCRADKVKGKWVLTYRINHLAQKSKYKIEVTALLGEINSRIAKKTVTTSRLPACDSVISGKIETGRSYSDGLGISRTVFVSGNTYSIKLMDGKNSKLNDNARIAGTDKLTWSSSNKKVANVKPTSGGYGATLKALKDGETVIEVRSSVLKGVIARVTVHVYTVGDAYRGRDYYGDNEELRGEGNGKKTVVTELTVGVVEQVEVSEGQRREFKVTLTEEGTYTAYVIQGASKTEWLWWRTTKYDNKPSVWLIGGISNAFTGGLVVERTGSSKVSGLKDRRILNLNEADVIWKGMWRVFTVPDDGMYGFEDAGIVMNNIFDIYKQSREQEAINVSDAEAPKYFYELKKGDMYYLRARHDGVVRIVKAKFDTLTVGSSATIYGGDVKWFEFIPAERDRYEFRISQYAEVEFFNEKFEDISLEHRDDNQTDEHIYSAVLNSKIYVKVDHTWHDNYWDKSTLQVNKKEVFQQFGEDGFYTVNGYTFNEKSDYLYISYRAPADGFYTFSYETAESGIDGWAYLYLADNMTTETGKMPVSGNGTETMKEQYLAEGTEVYLQIRAENMPATWNNVKFAVAGDMEALVEIQAAGEEMGGTVSDSRRVWYSFTAPEKGRYTVIFPKMGENSSKSITGGLYKNVNGSGLESSTSVNLANGGFINTISLDAGEKRFIKVFSDTEAGAGNIPFRIRIEQASVNRTVTEMMPVDLTEIENWVSFTAEVDGFYEFSVTESTGNIEPILYAYDNAYDISHIADGNSGNPLRAALVQGETIWLKATADRLPGETDSTDRLTVRKLREISAYHIGIDLVRFENLAFVEDDGICDVFVKIIADTNGKYTFSGKGNGLSYMELSEDVGMSGEWNIEPDEKGICTVQRNLGAGEAVYLRLKANEAAAGTGICLEVQGKEIITQQIGHVKVQKDRYQWLAFTAPEKGEYVFYSVNNTEGDPCAWFFTSTRIGINADLDTLDINADLGVDDDNNDAVDMSGTGFTGGLNFAKEISLNAGQTVYMAVGNSWLNEVMSCDVYYYKCEEF